MISYEVIVDPILGTIVKGDFNPAAIPINIPSDDPDRAKYIDYFLHKMDVDEAFKFLQCISIDKTEQVNKGLFIAGLNSAMKIFKKSAARNGGKIDKSDFLKKYPESKDDMSYYESLRDKHYIHDENSMIQSTAFLLLNPEDCPEKFGGNPSVVYNFVNLNYYTESQRLQHFLCNVGNYIVQQIDLLGEQISQRYENTDRQTIEGFGRAQIKLASTQNIDKNRM